LQVGGHRHEETRRAGAPRWRDYRGTLVVFGHYWRLTLPGEDGIERLFKGTALHETLGEAMCIDYSVGKRFRERLAPGFRGAYRTRLAALRLPEKLLVSDEDEGAVPLVERRLT
jgi:hypothetical protein